MDRKSLTNLEKSKHSVVLMKFLQTINLYKLKIDQDV